LKGEAVPYESKYQGNSGIQASMMFKDFQPNQKDQ